LLGEKLEPIETSGLNEEVKNEKIAEKCIFSAGRLNAQLLLAVLSVCLSVCPSVCLSICLSVCRFVCHSCDPRPL